MHFLSVFAKKRVGGNDKKRGKKQKERQTNTKWLQAKAAVTCGTLRLWRGWGKKLEFCKEIFETLADLTAYNKRCYPKPSKFDEFK